MNFKKGFYSGCDSHYFNKWYKNLVRSIRVNAPWADLHVHLFDPKMQDIDWCQENNISFTEEKISKNFDRRNYINAARFLKACKFGDDSISMICIDADSLMVNPLSENIFDILTQDSWVTVRPKPGKYTSLASTICLGKDKFRDNFYLLLKAQVEKTGYVWCLDQEILDIMLLNNQVKFMDMKFSDFYCYKSSFVWHLKGDAKERGSSLRRLLFLNESKKYSK